MMRAVRTPITGTGFTQQMDVEAFRARQAADISRYEDADGEYVVRRRPFHERLEAATQVASQRVYELEDEGGEESDADDGPRDTAPREDDGAGEEGWRNREGERLADFGVDEVADFYDEDDVPLAELIRRLKARDGVSKTLA